MTFEVIKLTRPGSPQHETRTYWSYCDLCGASVASTLQIQVSADVNQDPALLCVECWRSETRRIEYFAENPEATLP